MITIKTKEAASCWIGLLATVIVAGVLFVMHAKGVQIRWIPASIVLLGTFAVVMLVALFIIRKYVAEHHAGLKVWKLEYVEEEKCYEVKLSNRWELKFDTRGNLIDLDRD